MAPREDDKKSAVAAAKAGFDSIVFDLSALPIEENIRKTKEAIDVLKGINPSILIEGRLTPHRTVRAPFNAYGSPPVRLYETHPVSDEMLIKWQKATAGDGDAFLCGQDFDAQIGVKSDFRDVGIGHGFTTAIRHT